jgi:primosomal protein N' (replication factor Y)
MANLGEVMNAVLPAFLKLTSETAIMKNEYADTTILELNDDEYIIMEALELHSELTLDEVEKLMPTKNAREIAKKVDDKIRGVILDEDDEKGIINEFKKLKSNSQLYD